MDNLAKCAFLARQNRMSYGKYMALHKPPKEPVKKPPKDYFIRKICQHCGNEFVQIDNHRRLYCSSACKESARYERKLEAKQDQETISKHFPDGDCK